MTDQAVSPTGYQAGDQLPIPDSTETNASPESYVSAEEYLEKYAHDHYEWDNGVLIKMSPASEEHDELNWYLMLLLKTYFELRRIGVVRREPFLMRVDTIGLKREPDIQVILNENPGKLTKTAMLGPADICIEIVSEESRQRDFITKLELYEKAGVREYWMIDYLRQGAYFHRLNEAGMYISHPHVSGIYETPLLPDLKINVPTLWVQPTPTISETMDAVRAMLGQGA